MDPRPDPLQVERDKALAVLRWAAVVLEHPARAADVARVSRETVAELDAAAARRAREYPSG